MSMGDDNTMAKPWYREPWLWFVLSPMILVFFTSMVTVTIAFTSADDVVSDNYYKEGRMLVQETTSEEYAKALGLSGQLTFDNVSGEVLLNLDGAEAEFDTLNLLLSHPAQAALDQYIEMKKIYRDHYRADLSHELVGRWYIRLTAFQEQREIWRLNGELDASQQMRTPLE